MMINGLLKIKPLWSFGSLSIFRNPVQYAKSFLYKIWYEFFYFVIKTYILYLFENCKLIENPCYKVFRLFRHRRMFGQKFLRSWSFLSEHTRNVQVLLLQRLALQPRDKVWRQFCVMMGYFFMTPFLCYSFMTSHIIVIFLAPTLIMIWCCKA